MNLPIATHPSPSQLAAFGAGQLTPAEHDSVAEHVLVCDACCRALQNQAEDSFLVRLQDARRGTSHGAAGDTGGQWLVADDTTDAAAIPPELQDHPRYRVRKLLGAGGMGIVFEAEHRLMERTVALKVINPRLTRKPSIVDRFLLEVKAAARLSHPNIVAAHDAEQVGSLLFLVMEFVEGTSLDRVVQRHGPLPLAHACHYIRQAALGLQQAHERGMVHRDIKPQNLMLTKKGHVKILDFGLARLAREAMSDDLEVLPDTEDGTTMLYTKAGQVLGTPDYMAPEQIANPSEADIRSDIYGLGCTLYFLLTGRPPFASGSVEEKLHSHLHDQPASLAALRQDLPAEIIAIVEQMLAKDPQARFGTPADLAKVLAPLAKPSGSTVGNSAEAIRAEAVTGGGALPARTRPKTAEPTSPAKTLAALETWADPLAAIDLSTVRTLPTAGLPAFHAQSRRRTIPARMLAAVGLSLACLLLIVLIGGKVASWVSSNSHMLPAIAGGSSTPPRILLVVPPRFSSAEVATVRGELAKANARVTLASVAPGAVTSAWPNPETIDAAIGLSAARAADYDAVIFCNGDTREFLEYGSSPACVLFGRTKGGERIGGSSTPPIAAALGDSILVLTCAGLLESQRVACPLGKENVFRQMIDSNQPKAPREVVPGAACVVSNRVITGRCSADAGELTRAVLAAVSANR